MIAAAGVAVVFVLTALGGGCEGATTRQQQSPSFRQRIMRTTATVHAKRQFGAMEGQGPEEGVSEAGAPQRQEQGRQERRYRRGEERRRRRKRRRKQVSASTVNGHTVTVFDDKKARATDRINNGSASSPGKYPFFAQMWWKGLTQGCGGALIATKWVVTAAHCVESVSFGSGYPEWRVRAFCDQAHNCGETVQVVESKAGFIHAQYEAVIPKYDFALIELKEAVRSDVALPVHLDLDGKLTASLVTGQPVRGIGMGYINNAGVFSPYLQEIDNHFITTASCARYFTTGAHFDSSIMCTNGANFGMCAGDSGSPVLLPDSSVPYGFRQVSVTSFGPPFCESHNYPDGSAKLSAVAQWVKDTICPSYSSMDPSRPHYCGGTGFASPPPPPPPPPPTPNPSPSPTLKPSPNPTRNPTSKPTPNPTPNPTLNPTPKPFSIPTHTPSLNPTPKPSPDPTPFPTPKPSLDPTLNPSASPTLKPSPSPTVEPSLPPSPSPTAQPSSQPTSEPSLQPTSKPTAPAPSVGPTSSSAPSARPTSPPTSEPTLTPSQEPTEETMDPLIVDPLPDSGDADTAADGTVHEHALDECIEEELAKFFDHKKKKPRDCEKIRIKVKNYNKYCSDRTTAPDECPISCGMCDGTLS